MFSAGDQVRIRPGGVSIFQVLEFVDDDHVLVNPVLDAPGAYPFPMPVGDLVPADAVDA